MEENFEKAIELVTEINVGAGVGDGSQEEYSSTLCLLSS
jgi:hypothetical protein